ncbi:MAG: TolB-like protein/Tfp pilus assembly protein PilF [Rhodothermales bacterium]
MSFFEELKRRNVFRVGIAYGVVSWVLLQIVDLVLDNITAPDWIMHVFMLFVGLGFVVALVIAWAYEMTPEGIKREADVDRSQSVVADTGHKLDRIIIAFLAVAVVLLLTDRYLRPPAKEIASSAAQQNVSAETFDRVEVPESELISDPAQSVATGPSIAVLPFVNMSKDEDNEFFSDGISEEILNVLASIPELKVAARTSAFAYKGTNTQISQIAQELGVNHVLEGSVRKSGNQVRITAQLIKADDGFHVWSENFDRELTNIFAIQDEIAASIAEAMKVSLKLSSGSSGNLTGTQSIAAYEHYLQGMSLWHQRTAASLTQSIQEFEAAISLDPEFAKAHAGLAVAWAVYDGYTNFDVETARKNALEAANNALELDPQNVEAMASKAWIFGAQLSYRESEELFKQAIRIQPSFASAHQWYASLLNSMGNPVAALAAYRKAWSLDPRSRIIGLNLAIILDSLDRRAEGSEVLHSVLEFAPDFPDAVEQLMLTHMFEGRCDEAAVQAKRLAQLLNKQDPALDIYQDICQSIDPEKRGQALGTMVSWPEHGFSDPANPSLTYEYDLITILIEYGEFDLLWQFLDAMDEEAAKSQLTGLSGFRSENGIKVQCDPRANELLRKHNIPLRVDPVVCD